MFTYSPPAKIDDLAGRPTRDAFLAAWHDFINGSISDEIAALDRVERDPLFFSETGGPVASAPVPVTWNGFPRSLQREHGNDIQAAWRDAEQLRGATIGGRRVPIRIQDEYCEWHVYRTGNRIDRIVFTAEGPEYWIELAAHDFDAVVALYRKLVSPDVAPADLKLDADLRWLGGQTLRAGSYNPYNVWNTRKGVMHLTHPANTLGAEINLAAQATLVRADETNRRITDVRRLICCAGYGDPNRSSDPNIGHAVNVTCVPPGAGAALQDITLADPVGLYIGSLQAGAITDADGNPLDSWFRVVRGGPGAGLMAVLEPPAGAAFGLDQVKVKGIDLAWGGQVAEVIQMVLYAKVRPHVGQGVTAHRCTARCCAPAGTRPADYSKVNFDQVGPSASCPPGFDPAYLALPPSGFRFEAEALSPADATTELAALGVSKRLATEIELSLELDE